MCGGGSPPDPFNTAMMQLGINKQAISDTAKYNQVNQTNPFGSLTYSGSYDDPANPRSQNVTLNPELQKLLTSQQGISQGLTDAAGARIKGLAGMDQFKLPAGGPDPSQYVSGGEYQKSFDGAGPLTSNVAKTPIQTSLDTAGVQKIAGPNEFGAQLNQAQQAAFQGQSGLLQPGFDQSSQHLQSQLAAQGIDQGTPAYEQAVENLRRSQGSTLQQAAASAVGQGNALQGQLFGENLQGSQTQFDQALKSGQFGNDAQSMAFGQGMQNANLNNQAQGQQFGQNAAMAQFYNQALNSQQGQNLQIGQYNQGIYQNALQDNILGRNQNFNEASAFLNGSPVAPSNPNFAPTTQYQPSQASPNAIGLAGQNYQTQSAANSAIMGSIFGALGNVGGAAVKCWVAREVYGETNPRWLQMREWMETKAPKSLLAMYLKHGPAIAEYIRDKTEIKNLLHAQMEAVLG